MIEKERHDRWCPGNAPYHYHAWHRDGKPPEPITLKCPGCGWSFVYVLYEEVAKPEGDKRQGVVL